MLTEDKSHKNPQQPLASVPLDVTKLKDGSVAWFGYSTVLFQTSGKRFSIATAQNNLQIATPKLGEVFNINESLPQKEWWKSVE